MKIGFGVLSIVLLVLGVSTVPSYATPFVCGAGVEGQLVNCTGDLTVNPTGGAGFDGKVSLTFNTFTMVGGGEANIQWLGIQFPGAQTVDAANSVLPPGYSIGNFGGAGFSFEAEAGKNGVGTIGVGDTPFTFTIAYDGTDPLADAFVTVANQNGSCGGFHDNVWGCLHVQFASEIVPPIGGPAIGSQFVPLRAAPASVPEPSIMILLGAGAVGLGAFGRKKLGR